MKYYVGTMRENNGGKEYNHTVVFELPDHVGTPEAALENMARDWYSEDDPEQEGATYMFDCGGIAVTPECYKEVTEQEYEVLKKYL